MDVISLFGRSLGAPLLQKGRLAGRAHASLVRVSRCYEVFFLAPTALVETVWRALSSHEKRLPSTGARAVSGQPRGLFVMQDNERPFHAPRSRRFWRRRARLRRETGRFAAKSFVNSAVWRSVFRGKPGFHFAGKCSKTCAATVNRRGSRLSARQTRRFLFEYERLAAAGSDPAA
jgi:hypothetical protein